MIDQWRRCYNESWDQEIVADAFSHPAKFSRALIRRIYAHAKEQGWFKPGDWVLDPFGGVALGGKKAMGRGLNWIGVEIEEKFVMLGEKNIELWNRQLRGWPNLGTARIVQGDSRHVFEIIWGRIGELNGSGLILSSPPYAQSVHEGNGIDQEKLTGNKAGRNTQAKAEGYGRTPGNLANMKEGDIAAVIGSPPFVETIPQQDPNFQAPHDSLNRRNLNFGSSPGQCGSMREGDISAVISSPPYEGKPLEGGTANRRPGNVLTKWCEDSGRNPDSPSRKQLYERYGSTEGNVGNASGDTFWTASREIVQGCYDLLKPGGHAIWVCKDYVKAKKRVPFSDRWQALCESVGFTLICRHQAMLVESHGVKTSLLGVDTELTTERKSFFRRLAEKKGSPRIDFEDVICLRKG